MKKKKITGKLNFKKSKISNLASASIMGGGTSTSPTTCTEIVNGPHDDTGVGDGPAEGGGDGSVGSYCKCL